MKNAAPLPRRRQTVGLLGGSFNPAHAGHLHISREAKRRLCIDHIWWLVSPQNPLKSSVDMAPLKARLLQSQTIAAPAPFIRVLAPEAEFGSNYSYDTVRRLQKLYPYIDFIWIMGADNLVEFHRWYRWSAFFTRLPIAVFDRAPYTLKAFSSKAALRFIKQYVAPKHRLRFGAPPTWTFIRMKPHPASSTALRKNTKKSK